MSSSPRSSVSSMKSSSSASPTAASASSSSISKSAAACSVSSSATGAAFGFFGLAAGSGFGALRGRRDFSNASGSNCALQEGQMIGDRSEEHTSELQSLMRNSYAVFCLKKKNKKSIPSKHQNN